MNKTWKNHSRHSTFESADAKRKELLEASEKDFKVKVKFSRSENNFLVKTWSPPPEKTKSNKVNTKSSGKPRSKAQKRALREKKAKNKS